MKRPADDDLVYIYDVGQGRLVVWGMVAVFVAVYALGLPLPNRSSSEEASKAPPQRVVEVPKRDGGVMLAVMRPTVPALAIENLAFQVKNWPPGPTVASCAPFFTSMFAHGSIMHLGFNCFGFYQLSKYLMCTPVGIGGSFAIWLFGGLAATQLSCYSQKAYAEGNSAWYSKVFKKDPIDPNPTQTLNTYNLGASGGLMSMMGVVAVWRGGSLWGFPLIPIPIQARVIGLAMLGWDLYGNYYNERDGIGHNTHLCGLGVGAAIAVLGLRRGKYAKAWKIVVK